MMNLEALLGFVLIVVLVFWFVFSRVQRDSAWRSLAMERGGQFIGGGLFGSARIQVQIKHWPVTLDTFSIQIGDDSSSTFTRLRAPVQASDGFQFKISREGIFTKLHRSLVGRSVQTGIADFDRDFVVESNGETRIRSMLADVKLRALIEAQHSLQLVLQGNELRYEISGVVRDLPRLRTMFELFEATLSKLAA